MGLTEESSVFAQHYAANSEENDYRSDTQQIAWVRPWERDVLAPEHIVQGESVVYILPTRPLLDVTTLFGVGAYLRAILVHRGRQTLEPCMVYFQISR